MRIFAGCIVEIKDKTRQKIEFGSFKGANALDAPVSAPKKLIVNEWGDEKEEDVFSDISWKKQTSVLVGKVHIIPEKPYGPKHGIPMKQTDRYKDGTIVYADNDLFHYYEASLPVNLQVGDLISFLPDLYEGSPIKHSMIPGARKGYLYYQCPSYMVFFIVRNGEMLPYGYRIFGDCLTRAWAKKLGFKPSSWGKAPRPNEPMDDQEYMPLVPKNHPDFKGKILLAKNGYVGWAVFDWETLGIEASEKLPRSLRWVNIMDIHGTIPKPKDLVVKPGLNYAFMPLKSNVSDSELLRDVEQ